MVGVTLAHSLYVIARRAQRTQHWRFVVILSLGLIVVFSGILLWLYKTTFSPDLNQSQR